MEEEHFCHAVHDNVDCSDDNDDVHVDVDVALTETTAVLFYYHLCDDNDIFDHDEDKEENDAINDDELVRGYVILVVG